MGLFFFGKKLNSKKKITLTGLLSSVKKLFLSLFLNIRTSTTSLFRKLKKLEETNYKLGIFFYNAGKIDDAILRFKILKLFGKKYKAECSYYIGRCYIILLKYAKAKKDLFLDIEIKNPDMREELMYCRNLLEDKFIQYIPHNILEHKFDIISESYDALCSSAITYDIIAKKIDEYSKTIGLFSVLDIGCGTGILAKRCTNIKVSFSGVDISRKMIKVSETTGCYKTLSHAEAGSFVNNALSNNALYGIILLLDFFTYNPQLLPIFALNMRNLLLDNGILIISYKVAKDNEIEFIKELEEFRYNTDYIKKIFSQYTLIHEEEISLLNSQNSRLMIYCN
ncbi:SAM-dependent methyltransferase [Candidatus Cyrtobacter comes]|uniref:SAM-dependent methyltransferase n=1 Tax=Candidatus Cyrtobacter comes TaxID=675776 RepID=A0ABU5L8T5_9RICK|nr:methyltransferase domain-containing protein [Candidatus Cyrtobacter comes]MDZ5762533.1 SAM-dependent methyltransferase [Candidatus Cyrtobacter comes]